MAGGPDTLSPAAAVPVEPSGIAAVGEAGELGQGGDLACTVALKVFSGPLDLLLFLVRRAEVDINDIPIADIADQFVAAVHGWADLDLEIAGDFLVMATSLLELKARTIVPVSDGRVSAAEEERFDDPRADLVRRLLAFRAFKDAAEILDQLENDHHGRIGRQFREQVPDDPDELAGLDLGELHAGALFDAFDLLMRRIGGARERTVAVDDLPLGVRIAELEAELARRQEATLTELNAARPSPLHRVTTLMASLEAARQRLLRIRQLEQFGLIHLRYRHPSDRLPPADEKLEPEPLPWRRRSLPLASWTAPAGWTPDPVDEAEDFSDPEPPALTEVDRLIADLDAACAIEPLLRQSADPEAAFLAHWFSLHPELRPPEPPPVIVPPAEHLPPTSPTVVTDSAVPTATTAVAASTPSPEGTVPAMTAGNPAATAADAPAAAKPAGAEPLPGEPPPQSTINAAEPINAAEHTSRDAVTNPGLTHAPTAADAPAVADAPAAAEPAGAKPLPGEPPPQSTINAADPINAVELPSRDAVTNPGLTHAPTAADAPAVSAPAGTEPLPGEPVEPAATAGVTSASPPQETIADVAATPAPDNADLATSIPALTGAADGVIVTATQSLVQPDPINAASPDAPEQMAADVSALPGDGAHRCEPPLGPVPETARDAALTGPVAESAAPLPDATDHQSVALDMHPADVFDDLPSTQTAVIPVAQVATETGPESSVSAPSLESAPSLASDPSLASAQSLESVQESIPAPAPQPQLSAASRDLADVLARGPVVSEHPDAAMAVAATGISAPDAEVPPSANSPGTEISPATEISANAAASVPPSAGTDPTEHLLADRSGGQAESPVETASSIDDAQAAGASERRQPDAGMMPGPVPAEPAAMVDFSAAPADEGRAAPPPQAAPDHRAESTAQDASVPLDLPPPSVPAETSSPASPMIPLAVRDPGIAEPVPEPPPDRASEPPPDPPPPRAAPPPDPLPPPATDSTTRPQPTPRPMPAPPITLRRWQLAAGLAAAAGIGVGAMWLLSPPRAVLTAIDPPTEGAVLADRQPLRLRFNLPVLAENIEDPAPLPARFAPAIAGAWRWIDRSTAEFAPSQPWPLATPIAVTVPADQLRTADGFRLATDLHCRMRGEVFAVRSATVTGFAADGTTRVRIVANQPMSPARLAGALGVTGWTASAVTGAEADSIDLDLRPLTSGPPRGLLALTLPGGFAGSAGPTGLESAWSATVAAGHRLVPMAVAATAPAHGDASIHLVCSGTLGDAQLVARQIWIDPPVPFQAAKAGDGLDLRGPFVPGTAYQISVTAAWPADHPEAKLDDLPAAAALTVVIPHRATGLWFAIDGGSITAQAHRWPGATVQLQDAAGNTVAQMIAGEPGACEPAESGRLRAWPVPISAWLSGRSAGAYRLALTAGGDRAEIALPVHEAPVTAPDLLGALATIPAASPLNDRTGRLRVWGQAGQ